MFPKFYSTCVLTITAALQAKVTDCFKNGQFANVKHPGLKDVAPGNI